MSNMIKQLSSRAYKKRFTPIIILSVASLMIWYGGPLLAISDFIPLAQPEKRGYAILCVFLLWVFIHNIFNIKSPLHQSLHFTFNNPELTKKLHLLDTRFRSAIHFLKKTFIVQNGKDASLRHLPWYLLIGSSRSGKTTLLANANIPFVLARKFKQDHFQTTTPSDVCDWWVTREMVFVDVPSAYLNPKLKNPTPSQAASHAVLWRKLLSLIKKHRGKKAIKGVILTLPLPELLAEQQYDIERIVLELKQRGTELKKIFGASLGFHLVITKCDLLPGFLEFFSDSGSDELAQAWGVTMPAFETEASFLQHFVNRFNVLIKRLNKQLIWRLHQERNPSARPHIKDFPLQVERLKESILSTLRMLEIGKTQLNIQGIYLTSAIQFPVAAKATQLYEASTALQTAQLTRYANAMYSKSYFTRQLLLQGLTPHSNKTLRQFALKWKNHPYLSSIAVGIVLLATGMAGSQLRHHIQLTHAINAGLAQYQHALKQVNWQNSYIADALPLFHALQQAIHDTEHSLLARTDQKEAVATYHRALQKIVLPEIKHDLESYLTKANNKNPQGLYVALKAYLMLGDKTHYEPDFIFAALKFTTPALFNNNKNNDEIIQQIHTALTDAWQPMNLSPELIHYARKQMLNLVPAEIGYAILKSYAGNNIENTVSLGTHMENQSIFISKQTSDQIPKIFTGADFADIYTRQIPMALAEMVTTNWVLGTGNLSLDKAALTQQIRNIYIANYIDIWESKLANIGFRPPQDLADIDTKIVTLTSKDSPLLKLISTIKQNTGFTPILTASPKLAEINAMLTAANEPNGELYKILIALNQLHTSLQTILRANDQTAAAFQVAQAHMQNAAASVDSINQLSLIAESSPAPVKNWLENILTDSWHFILQEAANYIDNRWQSEVMPVYNAQIANRFPFTSNATQEISLEQFSKFLGTQGVLATFFRNYLEAFADNSNKIWMWKTMHNEHIPFSDAALSQIQHAAHVQRAFFPDGSNQPMIRFTLQPFAAETNTKSFQLNIEGQIVQYDRALPSTPQSLTWPSPKDIHATILNLLADNDAAFNDNSNTEWGWFHLVEKSTQKIINPKQLILTFDINGHKASVALYSQGHVNPFLPTNLQDFRLPTQLRG